MKKEYSAKTVDEAITKACIDLGMSSDQIDIEVVNEGSTGFLGFGSKPAVIRVEPKTETEVRSDVKADKKLDSAPKEVRPSEAAAEKSEAGEVEAPSAKAAAQPVVQEDQAPSLKKSGMPKHEKTRPEEPVVRTEEEIAKLKDAADAFLSGVFGAMDLPVEIKISYEADDDVLAIDFEGEDMGILIGKRGQTLDSLQYLTSLVVNRVTAQFVRVKLDTEDYRRRRKETLENLANNIARKVRKTGHPVSLEPMNPYERRIIHSYLQNNRYVETYSEGTEPYRHVVISPIH